MKLMIAIPKHIHIKPVSLMTESNIFKYQKRRCSVELSSRSGPTQILIMTIKLLVTAREGVNKENGK